MRTTKVRFEGIDTEKEKIEQELNTSRQKPLSSGDDEPAKAESHGTRVKKNNRYGIKEPSHIKQECYLANKDIGMMDIETLDKTDIGNFIPHYDNQCIHPDLVSSAAMAQSLIQKSKLPRMIGSSLSNNNNNIMINLHLKNIQNIFNQKQCDKQLYLSSNEGDSPQEPSTELSIVDKITPSKNTDTVCQTAVKDLRRNQKFRGGFSNRHRYSDLYFYCDNATPKVSSNHRCTQCDMRFKYQANLNSHLLYVHNDHTERDVTDKGLAKHVD